MKQLARKYKLFGFTPRDNVEFICMYGFNTTLAEDVERFRLNYYGLTIFKPSNIITGITTYWR